MKKTYFITFTLLLLLSFNLSLKAQSWTVGIPVDMQMSYLTKYSGFCAPGQPDFKINVICNQIDGIQYMIIVDSLVDIAVIAFANDTVELGDTLLLNPGNNFYTFSFVNGPGNISFNVKAVGTPTTAGQTHPCAFNDAWTSNLLLCNEELTLSLQNDCAVNAFTNIESFFNDNSNIQFPNANNQYQLQLNGLQNVSSISLFDVTGKVVKQLGQTTQSNINIPLQELNAGVYFVSVTQNASQSISKFVINK